MILLALRLPKSTRSCGARVRAVALKATSPTSSAHRAPFSASVARHEELNHETFTKLNTQPFTNLPTPLPMDVRDRHAALRRRGVNVANADQDNLIGTSAASVEHANIDELYFPVSYTHLTLPTICSV